MQVIGHGCKDWLATEAVHTFLQKNCGRIEQKNKLNTVLYNSISVYIPLQSAVWSIERTQAKILHLTLRQASKTGGKLW